MILTHTLFHLDLLSLLLVEDRRQLRLGHDGRLITQAHSMVNVHIILILGRGGWCPDLLGGGQGDSQWMLVWYNVDITGSAEH